MRYRSKTLSTAVGFATLALTACGGGEERSVEAFCDAEAAVTAANPDVTTEAGFDESVDLLQAMADTAPEEIMDDVQAVVDVYRESDGDLAALEEMITEDINAGSDRVDDFIDANCG